MAANLPVDVGDGQHALRLDGQMGKVSRQAVARPEVVAFAAPALGVEVAQDDELPVLARCFLLEALERAVQARPEPGDGIRRDAGRDLHDDARDALLGGGDDDAGGQRDEGEEPGAREGEQDDCSESGHEVLLICRREPIRAGAVIDYTSRKR